MANDTDSGESTKAHRQTETPTRKYVVYVLDSRGLDVHGGPYPPMKAREVRDAMNSHIEKDNRSSWSIHEDAVRAKTMEELPR